MWGMAVRKAMWVGRVRTVTFFVLALLVAVLIGLVFEAKPARAQLAGFTVNSTADTGDPTPDGTCDTCTLREAIQEANFVSGDDFIRFNISGDGPHTISPGSTLPTITDEVNIDGYTQGDATATTSDDATENTIPLAEDGTNAVIKIVINGFSISSGSADLLTIGSGASNVVIRGLALGSGSAGIEIASGAGTGHRIEGNFIGTDPAGTTIVSNEIGVFVLSGSNVTIGGDEAGDRNLISGNDQRGVTVSTSGNTIEGNIIGLDKVGNPMSNFGDGVRIQGSGTGNSILDNSISSNGGLGINLVGGNQDANDVTANDPKDPDTGANNLQNYPVISSAVRSSDGTTTIKGSLNSRPRRVFTIQFFSNPSVFDPEGEDFLGELNVRTNRFGKASFSFITIEDVAVGEAVTATATAFATGDTSEFSAARTVSQS